MERVLESTTPLRCGVGAAREVLRDHPGKVVADGGASIAGAGSRSFVTKIPGGLGHGADVTQEVEIEIGPPIAANHGFTSTLRWAPTNHGGLVPSFDGRLSVTEVAGETHLVVGGISSVPLGPLGRFGDRVLGRRLARRTLGELVRRVADRIDTEANHRRQDVHLKPAPYNIDLRDS